jgi:short-subunit dehydrogenase
LKQTDQTLSTHYTIILGAEGELGRALAREVARKGCNLVIVSTTSMDLQRFAIGLQLKEDVQVEAVKLDLGDRDAILRFSEEMGKRYEIRALINNITCDWSIAHHKCIAEIAQEDFITRFRGAALVTMGLLPHLKTPATAYIQHIIPFPFRKEEFGSEMQQSVSKMYAFTRELEEELRDSGISVSMVHPAPVSSMVPDFEISDGLSDDFNRLTPRIIAMKAVNGMLRGNRLIIPGFRNKILFFLNRQATAWLRAAEDSMESSLQPSV